MVIWLDRDEDHRGDALYINFKLFLALHHAETEAGRGHSKLISTRIALIVPTEFFNGSKLLSAIESKRTERKRRNYTRRRTKNINSK